MRLYLDMDGVLMDFDRAVRERGIVNDGYYHTPTNQWTPEQKKLHASIIALLNKDDFWPSLQPMDDAASLWGFCRQFNPHILTAVLSESADPAWVGHCKRASILRYFDPLYPMDSQFHICLRAEKRRFAKGNVLVDDNPGNCAEWQASGGVAILHKSAGETINKLATLMRDRVPPFHDMGDGPRMVGADRLSPAEERRVSAAIAISREQAAAPAKLRHRNSAERKAEPIHSGPMKYHPDALAAHARLCVAGNRKHNGPDAPLSWARGKSDDHLECAARHMLTPDAIDPETGETELTAAFWRLGCALQLQQERLLKEKGIMPYSGVTP